MLDLNALTLPELFAAMTGDGSLERLLLAAREEDLGAAGDVTTRSLAGPEQQSTAMVVAREEGVACGIAAIGAVIEVFGAAARFDAARQDGDAVSAAEILGSLSGSWEGILGVERTMLNLVGRLSGVATLTRRFVEAVSGTPAVICETRKTTLGLRKLEKYAVRCGGGTLHRLGLHDAVLYKDNHLAHIASDRLREVLTGAIRRARAERDLRFVEVEVDDLEQLSEVLGIEEGLVDMVLLDNMPPSRLREAVAIRNAEAPDVLMEASGGVTLETVREIAKTGVDRISVGALTRAARSLDIGLDVA